MQPYNNRKSGIIAYELGEDFIVVRFEKGGDYTYSVRHNDFEVISTMKELAESQDGLNTYINQQKPDYD